MAIFIQVIGLLLLIGGMWFGYWQWIRPHNAVLTTAGLGLLILVDATMMGGLIGSPFWWTDQLWSFSWDLPPLASRMLGAAGLSFFAVSLMALRRPVYRRLRLILILLVIYLAPLVVVILLFHLNRFDFKAPITYGFFAIAAPMTVAALWYLFRQPVILSDEARDSFPASVVIQFWLWVVAFITGLWGLALFVTDNGPTALIWTWPGDLLSSRLIGVMLLTICVGALYAFRTADASRMMLVMILVYSLGLTLAALWNIFFGLPIKPLYTAIFGVICVVTTVLFVTDKQPDQVLARSLSQG
jgi:hypothetical protein